MMLTARRGTGKRRRIGRLRKTVRPQIVRTMTIGVNRPRLSLLTRLR